MYFLRTCVTVIIVCNRSVGNTDQCRNRCSGRAGKVRSEILLLRRRLARTGRRAVIFSSQILAAYSETCQELSLTIHLAIKRDQFDICNRDASECCKRVLKQIQRFDFT